MANSTGLAFEESSHLESSELAFLFVRALDTLAALYDANLELLRGREKLETSEKTSILVEYWSAVADHMPDWTKVLKGQKLALELRQERISSHSTVLRALGGLGIDLLSGPNWQAQLSALEAIDWLKKNPEWNGVCVSANSVLSNRQARAATKAFIKSKIGLSLTESETKSLPSLQVPSTERAQHNLTVIWISAEIVFTSEKM